MKTIVVVPTYQEAGSIRRLLDTVLDSAPQVDVLVVDDASPDGTAALVAAHPAYGRQVFLLSRAAKDGLGAAYRAGFGWSLEHGYEAVVQMDADLSHPPAAIPDLIGALRDAELVIGSRYVPGGRTEGWPRRRKLISQAGNAYVRLVLGLTVTDATAGFRAFRADTLRAIGALESESDGYAFQVETTWRTDRLGMRILEVPITFTERAAGESKMSSAIVLEAVRRVLLWRLRELTGSTPTTSRPPVVAPRVERRRAA